MDKNYLMLLHAMEKRCDLQAEIISKQEQQIKTLTEMNDLLQRQLQVISQKLSELSPSADKAEIPASLTQDTP